MFWLRLRLCFSSLSTSSDWESTGSRSLWWGWSDECLLLSKFKFSFEYLLFPNRMSEDQITSARSWGVICKWFHMPIIVDCCSGDDYVCCGMLSSIDFWFGVNVSVYSPMLSAFGLDWWESSASMSSVFCSSGIDYLCIYYICLLSILFLVLFTLGVHHVALHL